MSRPSVCLTSNHLPRHTTNNKKGSDSAKELKTLAAGRLVEGNTSQAAVAAMDCLVVLASHEITAAFRNRFPANSALAGLDIDVGPRLH
jgi:hypothetical protein